MITGIYPCGEGAGYAGGIMSAAIDGLKVASAVMENYRPIRKDKIVQEVTPMMQLICRQKKNMKTVFCFIVSVIFMKCFLTMQKLFPRSWN